MVLESEKENIEDVFKKYAINYSIDPSVQNNFGFLGWVPWGRTVMSFQEPLFKLKNLVLSKPIHTEYGYHLILKKKPLLYLVTTIIVKKTIQTFLKALLWDLFFWIHLELFF